MKPKQGTAAPNRAGDVTEFSLPEISAIKAISPEAFAAIEKLCGAGRNPFRNGGEDGRRDTDYYCGRLSIAHFLRDLRAMKMPTNSRGAPPSDLPNSPTGPAAEQSDQKR